MKNFLLQTQTLADGVYECDEEGILSPTSHYVSRPTSSQSLNSNSDLVNPSGGGKSGGRKTKLRTESASEIEVLKTVSSGLETMTSAFANRAQPQNTPEDIMGQFVAAQLKLINDNAVKQDVQMEIVRLLGMAIKKE